MTETVETVELGIYEPPPVKSDLTPRFGYTVKYVIDLPNYDKDFLIENLTLTGSMKSVEDDCYFIKTNPVEYSSIECYGNKLYSSSNHITGKYMKPLSSSEIVDMSVQSKNGIKFSVQLCPENIYLHAGSKSLEVYVIFCTACTMYASTTWRRDWKLPEITSAKLTFTKQTLEPDLSKIYV